jgi:hypothetical protein
MIAGLAKAFLLSLFAIVVGAASVYAHGGGLDTHGCHHDRKNGGYHCHRGPLAGQYFASKREMLATLEAKIQEPKELPQWM